MLQVEEFPVTAERPFCVPQIRNDPPYEADCNRFVFYWVYHPFPYLKTFSPVFSGIRLIGRMFTATDWILKLVTHLIFLSVLYAVIILQRHFLKG
jgi:hypothetical protein